MVPGVCRPLDAYDRDSFSYALAQDLADSSCVAFFNQLKDFILASIGNSQDPNFFGFITFF